MKLVVGIVLVVISAVLFTTPFYLQYKGSLEEKAKSSKTEQKMDGYPADERKLKLEQAVEYNKKLAASGQKVIGVDPWSDKNDSVVEDSDYKNVLTSDEPGVMGVVDYPRLGINVRIGHGTSDDVLDYMVGHLYGTSLPVGGVNTKSVLSAHRGAIGNPLFSRLGEAIKGDVFYIKVLGKTFAYKVKTIKVVEPTEFDDLRIEQGKDLVVLLTCTPYGINTHRLLVIGERATIPNEAPPIEKAPADTGPKKRLMLVGTAWVVASGVIVWGVIRFKKRGAKINDSDNEKQSDFID